MPRRWRKYRVGHQPEGRWRMWSAVNHGHATISWADPNSPQWDNSRDSRDCLPRNCVAVWVTEEVPE